MKPLSTTFFGGLRPMSIGFSEKKRWQSFRFGCQLSSRWPQTSELLRNLGRQSQIPFCFVPTKRSNRGLPLAAFPNIDRWYRAIDVRPAVARARAIGKDHTFKKEVDDETRRALFPSNYPKVAR
jgi:hypothetical protein